MSVKRIDSSAYLQSYGWTEGEALKKGGLKKPILVKHKWDKKGLGSLQRKDDGEAWWERLFDGQLKSLDVGTSDSDSSSASGIVFKQNKVVASGVSKQSSPLYQWFVKGESLKGTLCDASGDASSGKITVATTLLKDTTKAEKKSRKRKLGEEASHAVSDSSEEPEKKKKRKRKSEKHKHKHKHKDKDRKKKKKEKKSRKHSSSSKKKMKEKKDRSKS